VVSDLSHRLGLSPEVSLGPKSQRGLEIDNNKLREESLDGEIVSIPIFAKFAHLLSRFARQQQDLDLNHLEGQQYRDWETHGEVCHECEIFNIRAQKI
jgi:hypothetical protein